MVCHVPALRCRWERKIYLIAKVNNQYHIWSVNKQPFPAELALICDQIDLDALASK